MCYDILSRLTHGMSCLARAIINRKCMLCINVLTLFARNISSSVPKVKQNQGFHFVRKNLRLKQTRRHGILGNTSAQYLTLIVTMT